MSPWLLGVLLALFAVPETEALDPTNSEVRLSVQILSGPTPGLAGQVNKITVSGATPNRKVSLIAGQFVGTVLAPKCRRFILGVVPLWVRIGAADAAGLASFSGLIPAKASGHTLFFQAFDPIGCTASSVLAFPFP